MPRQRSCDADALVRLSRPEARRPLEEPASSKPAPSAIANKDFVIVLSFWSAHSLVLRRTSQRNPVPPMESPQGDSIGEDQLDYCGCAGAAGAAAGVWPRRSSRLPWRVLRRDWRRP
jgi:hypothetical protein